MRTNINIDDNLMNQAMLVSGIRTKKEMVNAALTEFIQRRGQKNLLDLVGKIKLADGYDYKSLRENR